MPAANPLRHTITILITLASLTQSAAAWDYIVSGSGRYTGHSTGVLDAAGTSSLVFMCSMSARGAINVEIAITKPASPSGKDVTVVVEVGSDRFEIEAVSAGEGNTEVAMTWGGGQPAVNAAARRVYGSDSPVFVTLGSERYEFAGAAMAENFATMLDACGGGR